MEEKTMDNVAENEIEKMEDLGQALEESYAQMESMIQILCWHGKRLMNIRRQELFCRLRFLES